MAEAGITASLVNELRQETGAGMMDCKKALTESGGDKTKALEYLRKKGKAAAEKRADRSAEQGLVVIALSPDSRTGALVELNSESDFVAKNDMFRQLATNAAAVVLSWTDADGKSADELAAKPMADGTKIGDALSDLIGKIGEKLQIGRFARLQVADGVIGTYIHSDQKLGVMVALKGAKAANADDVTLGRDLAMQVAASAPTFVTRNEVPAEKIASETELEKERARAEGKPEAAVNKIAEGRVNKWFSEVALIEQPFVKDPKVIIRDLIAATSKKSGSPIEVTSFVRVRVGA
ncbi:MAG TPA: translation elongation factor Ts [bacterium]